MTTESFVKLWTDSTSIDAFCAFSKFDKAGAYARAAKIRAGGIPLKHYHIAKKLSGRQIKELRRIAFSVKIVHRHEGFADYIKFVRAWQTSSSLTQFCQRFGYRRRMSATQIAVRLRGLGVPLKDWRSPFGKMDNRMLRELTRHARIEGTPAYATIAAQARRIRQLEARLR